MSPPEPDPSDESKPLSSPVESMLAYLLVAVGILASLCQQYHSFVLLLALVILALVLAFLVLFIYAEERTRGGPLSRWR